jgi:hypothetical protein
MAASHLKAVRMKVQRYRDGLREQGLRPIQIWVPDVDARSFRAAAHRQSLAVAASAGEAADQAFIDSFSYWGDE